MSRPRRPRPDWSRRGRERRREHSPLGDRGSGDRRRGRPSPGLGGEQVEGRRAVRELLVAGRRRVHDVWVSESAGEDSILAEIADLAAERGAPVRRVTRGRLDAEARCEAPQGVLAHAEPLAEVDLDALGEVPEQHPFLVVLDGITDPHNLGALLRTAECAGVTGVVLPRHRAVHVTPTVAKTAAGAIEYLALALVPGIPGALVRLSERGVWIVGLDASGGASLYGLGLATEPVALVMGSEGRGLGRLTRQRCDVIVTIPQRGSIASLNVGAAGAVACFEIARRRGAGGVN